MEACARLAAGLLRRCPGLALLATSREPLGVPGERVWPVPPLSVPGSPSLEAASRSEAARLFGERARAASPGFELTEKNAPAVAEVYRKLDGIPLAIELAASRVRSMPVAQISARLDDALGLLASGPRTAPPRQRTLRATIDWSYGLLSPPERALLRALSVFSGGFTLEAAEEVCQPASTGGAGEDRGAVLDLLSRLVDRSLVQVRRTGETMRYRLQEVIRRYASEKLGEAGEADTLRRRHAIFFWDFAEEAEPEFNRPDRGSGWVSWKKTWTTYARPSRGRRSPERRSLVCSSPVRSRGSGCAGAAWPRGAPPSSGRLRPARGQQSRWQRPSMSVAASPGRRVITTRPAPGSARRWSVSESWTTTNSATPTTRERIGLDLWPEDSSSQLRNALHSAMYRLRKALGPPDRIRYTGGRYAFDRTLPHSFDAQDFEEKTRRARQCTGEDPQTAVTLLEEAAELYRGDFLEGFAGGEWILTRQQELRESYIESMLLLGRLLTEQGEYSRAARAYRRALARDPYSAGAHAGLIRAYCRLGERGRAFQHYHNLQEVFHTDLGATPPPEVAALIERLRRGEEL